MSVCYDKLWKMLIDKRMNRTELKDGERRNGFVGEFA